MIWGQVLIIAWMLIVLGFRSRIVAALVALLALLPVHDGVSLAMALRGLWGDPSITTLQFLLLAFTGRTPAALRYGWRFPAAIVLVSVALYASTLGPWDIDLYRFGYRPGILVATIGAIALIAWWRGQALCLWLLAIDMLAWRAGLPESTNLWDALLDPLLMFVMLALVLRNGYRAHQNRNNLLTRS
ncbi:MAG: hypothetical protein WAO76_06115 [Georgfuchsia sp.]